MTISPDSIPAVQPPTTSPHTRQRTAGHIVAIVIGGLALLPGLGMLAGGSALAIGEAVATDDDGYFTMTLDRIESDGVAVSTSDLFTDDVEEDGPWVLDWLDLDVRLRVAGAGPTDEVFVGIARSADVEAYLAGAPHSVVVDLDDHTAEYRQAGGESTGALGSPLDQSFWAATASGDGEQELTWEARGGRWSIVVMNLDGTADVAADVEIGARSDAVTPIAVTLIVIGGITVLASIALIVIGARGRRTPGTPQHGQPPIGSPLPTPAPGTMQPIDDETRFPTPVG